MRLLCALPGATPLHRCVGVLDAERTPWPRVGTVRWDDGRIEMAEQAETRAPWRLLEGDMPTSDLDVWGGPTRGTLRAHLSRSVTHAGKVSDTG